MRQKKSGSPRKTKKPARARPPRTGKWLLYCDEAGNAGSNWLDTAQPYHVEAGWLVGPSNRAAFQSAIEDAATQTQAGELKGSTLLRRPSGVATIVRLLKKLGASGGLPFFIIADRRFCIAGKAVDTFLDPSTNPAAEWLPTSACHRRQDVWEIVSALPDEALATFAEAYRAPSPEGFENAIRALVDGLRAADAGTALINSFQAALPHAAAICQRETHASVDSSHGVATALNTPVFFHLVKKADRFMDTKKGHQMVVVHDEIRSFEDALRRTVEILSFPAGATPEYVGHDSELVRLGVQNVARFETAASSSVQGLQAADLLASSVARLARDLRHGRSWSDELHELAHLILPALMTENDDESPLFAGMLAHRDEIARLLAPVFRRFIENG